MYIDNYMFNLTFKKMADDWTGLTYLLDKYYQCRTGSARTIVVEKAKHTLSGDDYLKFLDCALAHLASYPQVCSNCEKD